jgi:hypothetical protein
MTYSAGQELSPRYLPLTASMLNERDTTRTNIRLLHVNHELEDVAAFQEMLVSAGFLAEFRGIPYRRRRRSIRNIGSFRDNLLNAVRLFLESQEDPVAVVEDGGYAVDAALRWGLDDRIEFTVEQTRFGANVAARALSDQALSFPVISCARSSVKCRVESQLLAIRLSEYISEYLTRSGSLLPGTSVLQFGYGILGRALALRLRDAYGCRVYAVDADESVQALAREEGMTPSEPVTLIVGSCGASALTWSSLSECLSHASQPVALVSVSSGEVEFSGALIDGLSRGEVEVNTARAQWGTILTSTLGTIHLLADGRPVNFFAGPNCSLGMTCADLLNGRLAEALCWKAADNAPRGGRLLEWASGDQEGPWVSEGEYLARFCRNAGYGILSPDGALATLASKGLYDRHPLEEHLLRAVRSPTEVLVP